MFSHRFEVNATVEIHNIPSRPKRTTPTLGFFMSRFGSYQEAVFGNYQETIWSGVSQIAEEDNAGVVCFVGGELNSSVAFQKHWNVIYDLASPANIDGLIILSAALQNYVSVDEMARFCDRYAPLPIVSIALGLEGVPSITIDNYVGLRALMQHLIEEHHYQHIAFVRGRAHNPEAEARYQAYIGSLKDYGISFDPDLVAPGDFTIDAGAEAVKLFLDQRKISFDAIVASNDNMAIGAWQELTWRGISIPEQVAVTGFDDVPEVRSFTTPLTTIRQPLIEQGRQAARMMLDHIRHGTPLENRVLGTELVVRESCGCSPFGTIGLGVSVSSNAGVSLLIPAQQRDRVVTAIQDGLCSRFPGVTPQSIEELVDAFFDVLKGDKNAPFLLSLNRMLRAAAANLGHTPSDGEDMLEWQKALSILQEEAMPCADPDAATDANRQLHWGRILITEVTERAYSSLRNQTEVSTLIQSEVARDINAASNTQELVDVLAQGLPRLDVRACFLALYEGEPIPPLLSRMIMAFHDGKKADLEVDGRLFPSIELIPHDILSGSMLPFLMVRPLVVRDMHFGFIVMEMNVGHWVMLTNTYEEFPEQIGSALYRTLLQQRIEQSNMDIQQRAAELAEANDQLEQFAYVASHDLQEPLRMVTSYLQLLERRYHNKLDSDAQEFIDFAVDGAARMKRMIDDLLAYSRVITREKPLEPVDCELLLTQALSNLEIAIEESQALITREPLPVVMADDIQLVGVFQNLIGNAIKFHADRQPQIHIAAKQTEGKWFFSVADNGIGIAPEASERIFVIFSRLHTQAAYPGTGIGLAICKKVIERHGGRIWVESQPGEGSTFFFTLPA
jgi:signal transduction histidine kinase/DNA-binding LacI/PurR family transcriptional regulator